jgi:hypothetical protein
MSLQPPLPKFKGILLEEVPVAEVNIVPPASPYEHPARLAVLGESIYASTLTQILLRYMDPQRLSAGSIRVRKSYYVTY